MIPTQVTPDDVQIRGDAWQCQILLDPSKSWAGSTFTVDTVPVGLPVVVDATHKGDVAPYVLLSLPAASITALQGVTFRWNLAEDVVLGRTFLTRTVEIRER